MPSIEINWPPEEPAREFADFPLPFRDLHQAWEGFSPRREYHRQSFGEWLEQLLPQGDLPTIQAELTRAGGVPHPVLLQRHFYWSATCFVRSFHLFLSYLVLDARGLYSWGVVTGYYSRFYFAKAFANLWLSTWVWAQVRTSNGMRPRPYLLYTGTGGVRILDEKRIPGTLRPRDSHASWWRLFAQLRFIPDFPEEDLAYVLTDNTFDQQRRHEVNYSDKWLEGFPELEWFDHTPDQMLAHAGFFRRRPDRDFTDLDRFFEEYASEDADVADFYTDEVQTLWTSVMCYLKVLNGLPIKQEFITREKLIILSERALDGLLPVALEGIRRSLEEDLPARGVHDG